jgi:hypothetical protein
VAGCNYARFLIAEDDYVYASHPTITPFVVGIFPCKRSVRYGLENPPPYPLPVFQKRSLTIKVSYRPDLASPVVSQGWWGRAGVERRRHPGLDPTGRRKR